MFVTFYLLILTVFILPFLTIIIDKLVKKLIGNCWEGKSTVLCSQNIPLVIEETCMQKLVIHFKTISSMSQM